MKTKGVFLPGDKTAHVKEWDISGPKNDEILVKIKAAALCASDLSIYNGKPLIEGYPSGTFITGHEPCGVVEEIGPSVQHLKKGDRVAIIAFIGCGFCNYCLGGEPNLCESVKVLGFNCHGGDSEYLIIPERSCLILPEEIDYVVGAISTDAIGNLYSTMKEMNVSSDDVVAITGMGPMGLSGVLVAAGLGATVIAIDPVESRLNIAKDLGAQYIINPDNEDAVAFIKNLTKSGADKAVECSASEIGINTVLNATKPHGIVSQIGETGDRTISIKPSSQLIWKKLSYIGSWYFTLNEWINITNFIITKIGNDKAKKLVSHIYPLEEKSVSEAFKLFSEHKTLKVVFTP
ncbi:MAG: hypothetical protein A2Z35_00095 [Actinobacteria bacterium RBG_19FT_COMBO_36_27]|nr:MAG: hypothetical protein A2Z35_00095 [Actinobacteria bacterium RBG_19FT_COMBO_36_27]